MRAALLSIALCGFAAPGQAATLDAMLTLSPGDSTYLWSVESSYLRPGDYVGITIDGGADTSTTIMNIFGFDILAWESVDIVYSLAAIDSVNNFSDPTALTWFTSSVNSLTASLMAGMDYILSIQCVGDCLLAKIKTHIDVDAVPLPAAVWLFASVLAGFAMFRKRQAA
ncbi:hypothetical protein E4634_07460 [Mangrovimicrobium sediminis]|uniref:VPLPA-CTERM sorting domain-containing protein n=1 Tax=Mangrovimicrobium sediminis TaxID=2562682 RepID=A0A4Z0M3E7_9GAMM|nr:VPLPA-CTERM sorting domain-containing protein [Haliea sp. SAOS-164]TGD73970.1 hypothetical protein E4634_07460 [Haliea sp. SAOS-164]